MIIKILRSTVSGHIPSSLQSGQIAINEADGILFWNNNGTVESYSLAVPVAPTQTAGDDTTKVATTAFVTAAIAALNTAIVASAPSGLNTLQKIAAAINDDANVYATLATAISNRLRIDLAQGLTSGEQAQGLLNLGAAPLASPEFTGNPTAPTPTSGDNTTKISTTAFVAAAVSAALSGVGTGYAPLASPTFTGNPAAPTPTSGDNTTKLATTAFVAVAIAALGIASYAKLASPVFTGAPTAPTPVTSDNTTKLATTSFVKSALAAQGSPFIGAGFFTSSATLTIPAGATKCRFRLSGGGGGASTTSVSSCCGSANYYGGGGGGGYVEGWLINLVSGNTLTLTIGAAGVTTGGGNSSLTSGTQAISPITANGGGAGTGTGGVGGTASGGNLLNIPGGCGFGGTGFNGGIGGSTPIGFGATGSGSATGYGGGAVTAVSGGPYTASAGGCIVEWYA